MSNISRELSPETVEHNTSFTKRNSESQKPLIDDINASNNSRSLNNSTNYTSSINPNITSSELPLDDIFYLEFTPKRSSHTILDDISPSHLLSHKTTEKSYRPTVRRSSNPGISYLAKSREPRLTRSLFSVHSHNNSMISTSLSNNTDSTVSKVSISSPTRKRRNLSRLSEKQQQPSSFLSSDDETINSKQNPSETNTNSDYKNDTNEHAYSSSLSSTEEKTEPGTPSRAVPSPDPSSDGENFLSEATPTPAKHNNFLLSPAILSLTESETDLLSPQNISSTPLSTKGTVEPKNSPKLDDKTPSKKKKMNSLSILSHKKLRRTPHLPSSPSHTPHTTLTSPIRSLLSKTATTNIKASKVQPLRKKKLKHKPKKIVDVAEAMKQYGYNLPATMFYLCKQGAVAVRRRAAIQTKTAIKTKTAVGRVTPNRNQHIFNKKGQKKLNSVQKE